MKAAVVPEVHGKWTIQEVPTPEPGPGEVLIRIQASGLC
jgi:D-arabinose 1-dehydrogenase-like Zn-dependent alcohol dehydrogenase